MPLISFLISFIISTIIAIFASSVSSLNTTVDIANLQPLSTEVATVTANTSVFQPKQTDGSASTDFSIRTVFSPPAPVLNNSNFGANIQRTMTLLATSTPEHCHTVRILFYGQSITKQQWWIDVVDDLKKRFPYAKLYVENRAIGGFAAPWLIRPAEHDLYPFYPDLMIFHVYGGDEDYERIIANVRRYTSSEIAFHSDYITWLPTGTDANNPKKLKAYEWHNYHSTQWLPKLAQKYGCELIEIRQPWQQYLNDNNLQAQDLLSDGVHLNNRGNFLLSSLVKQHLRYNPKLKINSSEKLVKTYVVGKDIKWKNGKLFLEFEGNRIDAIAANYTDKNSSVARILIDSKKPSQFPELYSITRPSDALGVDWPALIQVSSQKQLLVEDWIAVITEINADASKFKFEIFGSQTGFDGTGESDRLFVSNSGRVVIEPQNWWLEKAVKFTQKPIPAGFQIKWQVKPMFVDIYIPPSIEDPTQEYSTTLAQNLSNSKHTLEIITNGNEITTIQAIRVYQPPLK